MIKSVERAQMLRQLSKLLLASNAGMQAVQVPVRCRSAVQKRLSSSFANQSDKSVHVATLVYSNNKWRWAPGTVCEKIGKVMYTVWVEDQRMVRAHVNQLRSRGGTQASSRTPQSSAPPLDILLDAWSIPRTTSVLPPPSPSPGPSTSPDLPNPQTPDAESTPLPPVSSSSSSSSTSTSTSTSTSAASPEFASADSGPATPVQLPRRSSRTRRPPQWFDPYHLY